jgi:hypothetical protein
VRRDAIERRGVQREAGAAPPPVERRVNVSCHSGVPSRRSRKPQASAGSSRDRGAAAAPEKSRSYKPFGGRPTRPAAGLPLAPGIGAGNAPASFDTAQDVPSVVEGLEVSMTVKFIPNDKGSPAGKLADAELHFSGGPLDGLKLLGFAIWERKQGGRNVTFPSRQYSVNGERRSFALLRPVVDSSAQDKLRDVILEAYKEHEAAITEVV